MTDEVEVEHSSVPDIGTLSETIKCCLQVSDELPLDFTKLFREDLFQFNTSLIPKAV